MLGDIDIQGRIENCKVSASINMKTEQSLGAGIMVGDIVSFDPRKENSKLLT